MLTHTDFKTILYIQSRHLPRGATYGTGALDRQSILHFLLSIKSCRAELFTLPMEQCDSDIRTCLEFGNRDLVFSRCSKKEQAPDSLTRRLLCLACIQFLLIRVLCPGCNSSTVILVHLTIVINTVIVLCTRFTYVVDIRSRIIGISAFSYDIMAVE